MASFSFHWLLRSGVRLFSKSEPLERKERTGRSVILRRDARIRAGKAGECARVLTLALKFQPETLDALFHDELRSEKGVIAFAILEKVEVNRSLPHHQNIHFRTGVALLRHLIEKHFNGMVVG